MSEPKPWLKLSPEAHAVAKMLKERHKIDWPWAAIIAKDVIALRVVDGSLSLPLDPSAPPLRRRKTIRGRFNAEEAAHVLEEWRNGR